MNLINYNNKQYPLFQTIGNASQFAIPFAKYYCSGIGFDIGCMKQEWSYPGSIPIDISFNDGYDAFNLPDIKVDYIYSSHCLEHLNLWIDALIYWKTKLKNNGVLFLYLPDYSQEYWRPWNNKKHKHVLSSQIVSDCLKSIGYINVISSGVDLNNSFIIVAENDQ